VSSNRSQPAPKSQPTTRGVLWLWISGLTILFFTLSELGAILIGRSIQLWLILPLLVAVPIAYWLVRRGRHTLGSLILMAAIGIHSILSPLVQSGLGVPVALTSLALIGGLGLAALPRKFIGFLLAGALIVSIVTVFIDLFGSSNRLAAELTGGRWVFSFVILAIFGIYFAIEFPSLDIRTKIVMGILATGGISLGILAFFAFARAGQTISTLSGRLETSVRLLAEEQLSHTVFTEANLANKSFEDIMGEVVGVSRYWVSLQNQQATLRQGSYWDASTNLFELGGGQYGNSPADISSVFVPANSLMNDSLFANLNTSAYLDFHAPGILESHPSLLAVYAIDTRGVTRYYPNIELASLLPPDFDATKRPYYVITSPLFNPQRLPRWTIPYVDAAGGGLVVTVAAPVYIGDEFNGVVAADMTMENITQQIGDIKIGQTGYSFMVDNAGRIISMPPAGFELFGIQPEEINADEFFKQTILGEGSEELQAITRRMVAGGNGLLIVQVNGVDTYISFSPIKAIGYSVALVVPVSELQGAINTAQSETQLQIQSAVRLAAIILFALLFVATMISLSIGQIIAAPIIRLTQTADQIVGGDLTAQANVASRDEIGTLAQAFNTMTARLREIFEGLEQRVAERTSELASANEKNERRAKQFESIAQVASTISSTGNMDSLLPQITTVISTQFGFYHVGIFLLDSRREFAVLSAANSEGGQRMLARNHQLKVGETGIVGFVTGEGKPRVALDTGEDAVFFNNPDLPETRSEIALPLRVGDEVVGALDVQSTQPNAFDQEDISSLTTLADQVSIAIQNARQYEETRKALAEADLLSRQFVQTGWQQFTKSKKLVGIRHTGARATLLYRKNGLNKNENDLNWNQAKTEFNTASLSLPVKLHGEVIGSVDVRAPGNRKWEQDELDIVTAIIERAALAMENARLLAESQKLVAKERTIGEISAKISMQSDINELLKTAAQELGHTLPGAEIAIQFNKDDE